jgi:copper resistance protein D
MDDLLILARAIHLAATVAVSGLVFFRWIVAEPAFRKDRTFAGAYAFTDLRLERQLQTIFAVALLLVILSGVSWFAMLVATLSERPFIEALLGADARQVLMATQFGQVWTVRLAVAIAMAMLVSPTGTWRSSIPLRQWLWISLAAVLVGALAWIGHSGAAPGTLGLALLANDCMHLIAASAWVGALLPLALFLAAAGRHNDPNAPPLTATVTRRFSTLGVVMVAAILATGVVNTWHLVGSIGALITTSYGRLLLTKITLFLAMLAVAAINRLRLVPELHVPGTLRVLQRNALLEAALGLLIVAIVAVLGIMAPGSHADMTHVH